MKDNNNNEYIFNRKVRKSWLRIFIAIFVISVFASYGGYKLADDSVKTLLNTYSGSQVCTNMAEAQELQSDILEKAQILGAKANVSISIESPPTVTFTVISENKFPYGDNKFPINQSVYKIMVSVMAFLCCSVFLLNLFVRIS